MPYIPTEIVANIIRLSLPPATDHRSSALRRPTYLCAWSLVCRTWRELAQRELFRYPEINSKRSATAFLTALQGRPALALVVKSLMIREPPAPPRRGARPRADAVAPITRRDILQLCISLEELYLEDVHGFHLSWIDGLKGLRTLVLSAVMSESEAEDKRLYLPLLDQLSITYGPSHPLRNLFHPDALPSLRSLHLANVSLVSLGLDQSEIFPRLAHLDNLSLGIPHPYRNGVVVPSSELNTPNLFFDVLSSRRGKLEPLTTPPPGLVIENLRLVVKDSLFAGVAIGNYAALIAEDRPYLQALESIYVTPASEMTSRGPPLQAVCRDRGISIVYEEYAQGSGESGISENFRRTTREQREKAEKAEQAE